MPVRHIPMGGIQTVQVHHEERHRIGLVPYGDQVEVIGHEAVSADSYCALLTANGHQRHKILPIGVGQKHTLLVVASGKMRWSPAPPHFDAANMLNLRTLISKPGMPGRCP